MRSPEREYTLCPLAPMHVFALGTLVLVAALLLFKPRFALIPAAVFAFLFLAGLFRPCLQFFLPVICRGRRDRPLAALTFDDGPDPATTPFLLKLLAEHSVKAAFFVSGEKAEKHPELIREILGRGHEIGNHTYGHDVFLMLRRRAVVEREVARCQEVLSKHGIRPLAFRPPVGITSFGLFGILLRQGLFCAGYGVRPADYGNRRLGGLSLRIVRRIKAGDVILLHDAAPGADFDTGRWLAEVKAVIEGTANRGLKTAPLSEVLQRSVMESLRAGCDEPPDSVRFFCDALADRYDEEQEHVLFSRVRRAEEKRFAERIGMFLPPSASVLEIGAGTGRFTLPLSERCRTVLAVDPSPRVLRLLESKARERGAGNIDTFSGRLGELPPRDPFDMVCSFSSFEYVADLEKLLLQIRPFLKEGGILYFITARRSGLRFFAQVGNAMRQGIWMHARSRRRVAGMLKRAGFSPVSLSSFGPRTAIAGGSLLEAAARKQDGSPRDFS
ncbi:MAG: hypothetical protein A2Y86_01580 [Candidatus Aminicenantes bacterium RBG_13_62_12]|nr:MAG: hypothetical protein A2Y86_01580 [Candidatus Aminicenantes bacterium RBG_13_62_12]